MGQMSKDEAAKLEEIVASAYSDESLDAKEEQEAPSEVTKVY